MDKIGINGNQNIEELGKKVDSQFNNIFKNLVKRFEKKEILRISLSSGSSKIIDEYIDKRQKEVISHCISNDQLGYVLDAGMGAGRWTDFLCNRSTGVVGVDRSSDMLDTAKTNIKRKNVSFIRCSYDNLPFKNNTFDMSFCCFSLLYLIREIDFNKAVKELIRVTNANRKIIIVDITAKKPTITSWTYRRTSSQYIKAFLIHGAMHKEVHGYYIDYPIRGYLFIVKRLFKLVGGSSLKFNNNFWEWIEKRHYFNIIVGFPIKLIVFLMFPLDRLFAENLLQSLCPEKVFIFEKEDFQ